MLATRACVKHVTLTRHGSLRRNIAVGVAIAFQDGLDAFERQARLRVGAPAVFVTLYNAVFVVRGTLGDVNTPVWIRRLSTERGRSFLQTTLSFHC